MKRAASTSVIAVAAALCISTLTSAVAQDDRTAERARMVQELVSAGGGGARQSSAPLPSIGGGDPSAGVPMASSRAVDDHQRIRNTKVLEAMRNVPRHLFVPPDLQREAYVNRPLPIGFGQTISQPFIVAMMTELLNPKAGEKILEIGTGSGYQAAILTEFTKDVYTIEIVQPLHQQAKGRLAKFGLGADRVISGDGYFGLEKAAPFDGIIVTAAADHIPPPLIQQLKPGGRMIIPIGPVHATQRLVVVEKDASGKVKSRSVHPVRFVPLTGGPRDGAEKKQ
jgi:protein-L-isoaspartate(D-aspartate) O-methyltransferase